MTLLEALRETMGGGEDFNEENANERIGKRLETLSTEKNTLEEEILKLRGEFEAFKQKAASIEGDKDPDKKETPLDPELKKALSELEDARAEKLEGEVDELVNDGKITKKIAASIKSDYIGERGKRNTYALSRNGDDGHDLSLAERMINLLDENDPIELKEQSKTQGKALSREPAEDKDTAEANAADSKERGKRAAARRGLKAPVEEKV